MPVIDRSVQVSVLMPEELEIVDLLGKIAVKYARLPAQHPASLREFVGIIHLAQDHVMARLAARAHGWAKVMPRVSDLDIEPGSVVVEQDRPEPNIDFNYFPRPDPKPGQPGVDIMGTIRRLLAQHSK